MVNAYIKDELILNKGGSAMKNDRNTALFGAIIISIMIISGCSNIYTVDRNNPESVINATISAIAENRWEVIYGLLPKGQQDAVATNIRYYYPGDNTAQYLKLSLAGDDTIKSCKKKAKIKSSTLNSDEIVSYHIVTVFDNEHKSRANGYISVYKGTDNRWYLNRIGIFDDNNGST